MKPPRKPLRNRRYRDIEQINKVKTRVENGEAISLCAKRELEHFNQDPLNYPYDSTNPLFRIGVSKMDNKLKPVTEKRECLAATFCQVVGRKLTTCNMVDHCPIKNCKFKNGHEAKNHTAIIKFKSSNIDPQEHVGSGLIKIIEKRVNPQ